MKIVNRGFISVTPKKAFFDWANTFEDDIQFQSDDILEPTIYLIEEDFIEEGPIIERNFKGIFANELNMVTDIMEDWPEKRTMDVFNEWFEYEIGLSVFDCQSSDLRRFSFED